MKQRVVVTGLGPLTPVGMGKTEFWDSLINGKSGIGPITLLDTTAYPVHIAGEVKDFDPSAYVDKREAHRMDRFTQFAVAAASLAVQDSGLDIENEDKERIGVLVGSGIGGILTLTEQVKILVEKGPSRVSPLLVPMMIPDMAAGQISIRYGFRGPNQAAVSACASGGHAIGDAFRWIQTGMVDVMVCGGAEAAVSEVALAGFSKAQSLSKRNEEPERASRPFDKDRDGFVLAEGAGILILESLDHAVKRGAHIYAEIAGYGSSGDAYNVVAPAPGGEGAYLAMRMAINEAGLTPSDIGYVNAHGTSTQVGDIAETIALKKVFGDGKSVAISSTKSMTGHMLGAAGGVEAIATCLALREGILPATTNLETPDPECDLDYIPNVARKVWVEAALSNSFGFGGHNAVLLFRRYHGE